MMRHLALGFLVLLGCSGDDGDVESVDESITACEQMRDHLVDLRLVTASGVDRAAHREAMRSALGKDFVERCQSSMTPRQINCVLYALDSEAALACAAATR